MLRQTRPRDAFNRPSSSCSLHHIKARVIGRGGIPADVHMQFGVPRRRVLQKHIPFQKHYNCVVSSSRVRLLEFLLNADQRAVLGEEMFMQGKPSSGLERLKRVVERKLLDRLLPHSFYFRQSGHCPCCGEDTEFVSYHPWLRDYFRCSLCASTPRNRALLCTLEKYFPDWRRLTIHESSPATGGASARLKRECVHYVSSHYRPAHAPGTLVDGHRNENLEAQTFADASFDLVITQDVLEHVYDPASVFKEIARTLRPGGAHVFTVPLINKHLPSKTWAMRGLDGKPVFIGGPEYHGNPIDARGSPVTMHWGYDIVDHIREACGLDTIIEYPDNLQFGVRAEYIEVLVTRRWTSPGTLPRSPSKVPIHQRSPP